MKTAHLLSLTVLSVALAAPAIAQEFLGNGGGVRSGAEIGFDSRDDDFLAGGGGIEARPEISSDSESEEFLEDGGGISIAPDYVTTRESEEFLEDGGGISAPIHSTNGSFITIRTRGDAIRPAREARPVPNYAAPAWRDAPRVDVSLASQGSFTIATSDVGDERNGYGRRGYGRTSADAVQLRGGYRLDSGGAKVIDIETERLDRRPYPSSGIDIVYTGGGSKIIRIAPSVSR